VTPCRWLVVLCLLGSLSPVGSAAMEPVGLNPAEQVIASVSARVRVDGFSMMPTLQDGEYVLVNRIAYRKALPQRGDIVVFRYPFHPEEDYIKRVVGLPGDEVVIENGRVIVNGTPLDEPYIAAPPRYSGVWAVPKKSLFVLGDNRNDSSDSHTWGYVPMDNLVGKAIVVYWPPQHMM